MLLPLYQRITNGFLASRALIEQGDSSDAFEVNSLPQRAGNFQATAQDQPQVAEHIAVYRCRRWVLSEGTVIRASQA